MRVTLNIKPLETASFSKYGHVIGAPAEPADIDKVQRWANVSIPDFQGGKPVFDILYSNLRPLAVAKLERHRNSTQTFIPLSQNPFLMVVGEAEIARNETEGLEHARLEAFISNGRQGITLSAGVWHCSPLPIGGSINFIILHRSPDVDLDAQLAPLKDGVEIFFELK